MNPYRETTHVSWFRRMQQSITGIGLGLLLVIAAIVGLFWNEGRAVQTAKSLEEGAGIVVSVAADAIDPANEGRLVHVTGRVVVEAPLVDDAVGVSASGVRLERVVEMYQWKETSRSETRKKLGGGEETVTVYTYSRDWSESPIDSSQFRQPEGRSNPPMGFSSQTFSASSGKLGAFELGPDILRRIGSESPYPIGPDTAETARVANMMNKPAQFIDGVIFLGYSPANPRIGDYRISYRLVKAGETSIVARQKGSGFAPYQTRAGNQLLIVRDGIHSAEKIFADAQASNTALTWVLRGVGILVMMFGFSLVMRPIAVIADVIPFLGFLVRKGTGIIAFVLAAFIGSLVIAAAWFYYRPLLALGIVAGGAAIAIAVSYFSKGKPPEREAETPAS